MKVLWLFFLVFIHNTLDIDCGEDDEFITIWAPKRVYEQKDYNVVVLPTNIRKRTEVTLHFRKNYGTFTMFPDMNNMIYKSRVFNKNTGSKTFFNLTMIVHRNETENGKSVPKCMTQSLHKIEAEKKYFHIFIQTDKPIYKPGDLVRFRIVVIDRDLKPLHVNNIDIDITDPLNRNIRTFDDPGKGYIGVFNNSFILSENTALGLWNIYAVIDKKYQWKETKTFAVQKIVLPPFDAYIEIPYVHFQTNGIINLSFFAKYSFGDYVKGNVKLTINCVNEKQEPIVKNFQNVIDVQNYKIHVRDILRSLDKPKLIYEINVLFTEPESEISRSANVRFTVHAEMKPKILPNIPDEFTPGLPLAIKVFIYDWDDTLILQSKNNEPVDLSYIMVYENNTFHDYLEDRIIVDGVAAKNLIIPNGVKSLKLKIKYINEVYFKEVRIGNATVGVNLIDVHHEPEFPEYDKNVTIFIRADSELDRVIAISMTRHGNTEMNQVDCHFHITCSFSMRVRRDMMPKSKVIVYYVKEKDKIYKGETIIRTKDLSGNYLHVSLPKAAETKTRVKVNITTRPDSAVYLLGYDKRLTYLRKGNEITKGDIVEKVAHSDEDNEVTVFEIEKSKWHICTASETKKIEKGRSLVKKHSDSYNSMREDEDFDVEEDGEEEKPTQGIPSSISPITENIDDIREDFREVWLLDDFITASSTNVTSKSYVLPDSITSWMVTAFSMNKVHGIAVSPTTELMVKKQFFTKLSVPYSIRYREKLRLDIIVHNYVESAETIHVDVELYETDVENPEVKSSLRYFENHCDTRPMTSLKPKKSVSVPYKHVKRVSFYVQSIANRNEKFVQTPQIKITATGRTDSGKVYKDNMKRYLRIEPTGVKSYTIESQSFRLLQGQPKEYSFEKVVTVGFPKLKVVIGGDYLSDTLSLTSRFEFYPWNCLEQKTSKLKGNVEYYRYLKLKGSRPPSKGFSSDYQSILKERTESWSYTNTTGYRAYFIEAILAAMEINAIPWNKPIIEKELDALKQNQNNNGSFNDFGDIPFFEDNSVSTECFQTAFVLISFIKYRKEATKSYEDVIENGFKFLSLTLMHASENAQSVSALAYALNNDNETADALLLNIENLQFTNNNRQKCYRILKNSTSCDLRHTSYTVLAYVARGQVEKVKSVVFWLLQIHNVNKYFSNTQEHAIAMAAIASVVGGLAAKKTDFTVNLRNEHTFNETIHITEKNKMENFEIDFPDYSSDAKIKSSGVGFCSITRIIEKTINIETSFVKFDLTVKPSNGALENEKIVQICALHNSTLDDRGGSLILNNVIYDVEFPSGFIYSSIIGIDEIASIKKVDILNKGSRIQIYYNEFADQVSYCVDIKATKVFQVSLMQKVGVQVYDYRAKENVAVEFYDFGGECK